MEVEINNKILYLEPNFFYLEPKGSAIFRKDSHDVIVAITDKEYCHSQHIGLNPIIEH